MLTEINLTALVSIDKDNKNNKGKKNLQIKDIDVETFGF